MTMPSIRSCAAGLSVMLTERCSSFFGAGSGHVISSRIVCPAEGSAARRNERYLVVTRGLSAALGAVQGPRERGFLEFDWFADRALLRIDAFFSRNNRPQQFRRSYLSSAEFRQLCLQVKDLEFWYVSKSHHLSKKPEP